MPVIVVHRHTHAIYRGRTLLWHDDLWTFDPVPYEFWESANGFNNQISPAAPVAVVVPVGSDLATVSIRDRTEKRLRVYFDPFGLTPESVWRLARSGERGFKLKEAPVLQRSLFDESESLNNVAANRPEPAAAPAPEPMRQVADPDLGGFRTSGAAIDAYEDVTILLAAIDRAIEFIRSGQEQTAKTILELAKEDVQRGKKAP